MRRKLNEGFLPFLSNIVLDGGIHVEDTLKIYPKIVDRINSELKNSEEEKKKILGEVRHEDTLVATLRLHLYAEKELDNIIESMFNTSNITKGFKNKLDLLHNLGIMDKHLFDAVLKLNHVRNGFAHNLDYGKNQDVYSNLKSGLSNDILKGHEIDVKMAELLNGEIDDEYKIRILLSGLWIQLKIFSTSILLKKFDFARRLQSEVIEELNTVSHEN